MKLPAAIATLLSVSLPALPALPAASAASILGAGEGHCEEKVPQRYKCSGDKCVERFSSRGAEWVQLDLRGTDLVGGAVLHLTPEGGGTQVITAENVKDGNGISAQFEGTSIDLKLLMPKDSKALRAMSDLKLSTVKVNNIIKSFPCDDDAGVNSICGTVDDRMLSEDPRQGRMGGCTAWLISEDIFVWAGHCGEPSASTRMHFTPNSSAAPPNDQYAVVPGSYSGVNEGVGNDWGVGRLAPNQNTTKKAGIAQGDWYELGDVPTSTDGKSIRITGYGVANVKSRWQKTHEGALVTIAGSHLKYVPDTSGGNSGSPVVLNDPNHHLGGSTAVGIHTHGGCSSSGGSNTGTRIDNAALQAAIASLMSGTPPPTPAPVPCSGTTVQVEVLTDRYPVETSWEVKAIELNTVVMSRGSYSDPVTPHMDEGCLAAGNYNFTIADSYGDGICCTFGTGSFALHVDGAKIAEGGDFGDSFDTTFEIEDPATPPPTPAPTTFEFPSAAPTDFTYFTHIPTAADTQFPTYFTCRKFNQDECADAYDGGLCQWVGDCHNCGCVPSYRET